MHKDIFVQKFYETISSLERVSCRFAFNVKKVFRKHKLWQCYQDSVGSSDFFQCLTSKISRVSVGRHPKKEKNLILTIIKYWICTN